MKQEHLFAFPIFVDKVDPKCYDKDKIVSAIVKNYNKDPERNTWDKESNLHHAYRDWHNNKFDVVDFSTLVAVYEKKISEFLGLINFNGGFSYSFDIVNYNCLKENQYMAPHKHLESFFSGIHYLKFDTNKHQSVRFFNPNDYAKYWGSLSKLHKYPSLCDADAANSWGFETWQTTMQEDEIVFFPGILSHDVPVQKSDEARIAVVININSK